MNAVGFRFHPTEEEIITYYLALKMDGRNDLVDEAIGEIDVYRREPWDLPVYARLTSDDQVWYFFCRLEMKYANSKRANRTTRYGFWKVTGNPRNIKANGRVIGTKKNLVFHIKRGDSKPVGTNWVIHEYQKTNLHERNPLVLCKLKNKAEEAAGNDEGEASGWITSDGENHPTQDTILGGALHLLEPLIFGDNDELNYPTGQSQKGIQQDSRDDKDADWISYLIDPDELNNDNTYIRTGPEIDPAPTIWSSNLDHGQTSSKHLQMQSAQGDDILLMRDASEDSDASRHNEINLVQSISQEYPKIHKPQNPPKSINVIETVSPSLTQWEGDKLEVDMLLREWEGPELPMRVRQGLGKRATNVSRRIRLQMGQAEGDFSSTVSRDTGKIVSLKRRTVVDLPIERSSTVEPEKGRMFLAAPPKPKAPEKPPLQNRRRRRKRRSRVALTEPSRFDRARTFIRMETIRASHDSSPPSVYLFNALVGLLLLILFVCHLLFLH